MKALIVDHSAHGRQTVSNLLCVHFPKILVKEAENKTDACHLCATFKPDLLIIDIYAPTMNGVRSLLEIKEMHSHGILIVFSDFFFSEQRKLCLEAGANELIYKGDKSDSLITAIAHALQAGPTVGALHHKKSRDGLITSSSYEQLERIEQLIVQQMNQARKEEMLTVYSDLLGEIWQKVMPILGRVTLGVIVEHTRHVTRSLYPLLADFAVTDEGVDFHVLSVHLEQIDLEELRKGLQGFVTNFIVTLGTLTSRVMVNQLINE
ncbi:MAG: response regulator [Caldilineaceae bacterium]